jgi:hypothetical protein
VEAVSKWASSSRRQARWRVPQLGNAACRAVGSPRWPLLAPADGSGRVAGRPVVAKAGVAAARTCDAEPVLL